MRVSADTKKATCRRILGAARELFGQKGYDSVSTRELARTAGIATGTLFNYFATKETIAMALVAEALEEANQDFAKRARKAESLEEDLFSFVAVQLRRLKPHRGYLESVLERSLSPLARADAAPEGEAIRVTHLETVAQLLHEHGWQEELSFALLHLYWTLYVGMLAFWSRDGSRHQENTLAVLDQALKMFVHSLPVQATTSQAKRQG
jgi:AcrR family transcriptional regulator